MKILVTGKTPFPGAPQNPTREAMRALANENWTPFLGYEQIDITYKTLYARYEYLDQEIPKLFDPIPPDLLICFGLDPAGNGFRLERFGHNVVRPERKDLSQKSYSGDKLLYPPNNRVQFDHYKISPDGPDAYPSTLPIGALIDELHAEGFHAWASDWAGGYTCNFVAYRIQEEIQKRGLHTKAGFIHVPFTHAQQALAFKRAAEESRTVTIYSEADFLRGIKTVITTAARSLQKQPDLTMKCREAIPELN